MVLKLGATAVGGGDFTVVSLKLLDVLVDSVTMGWANTGIDANSSIDIIIILIFIILFILTTILFMALH
jgi:hypothetical protein